jgi:aminoglycoside phosphotransferase (APT) family kinase protein
LAVALIGSGRSADVFEHGDQEVLRRYRSPRDTAHEVAAMEHARAHGFPVPAARRLSDEEIVMDRVRGPTMLADLARRPWRMGKHAATLASLHQRLHAIEPPDSFPTPLGEGRSLLHLDLHPDNVILAQTGPVVIDWPNAARGPGAADVAHTWIVLACSLPPTRLFERAASLAGRQLFVSLFLRRFESDEVVPHVKAAAAYRSSNRTLPRSELEAISRFSGRVRQEA